MKIKCIVDIPYFTKGEIYDYHYTDSDGDIWVIADDDGDRMFFHHDECEVVEE